MPWSFKATIAAFVIFIVGGSLIGFACVEGGWQSLGHFAWGVLIAGVGLIGALLFSIVCAATQPAWRRHSLIAGALAVLLFAGLLLFAKSCIEIQHIVRTGLTIALPGLAVV
jgi:hypothetical protein